MPRPGVPSLDQLAVFLAVIVAGIGWGNMPEPMVRDDLAGD